MSPDNTDLRKTRIYSGESKRDNRSHFQRDRDRILYTPALRRLTGVTQVVHATTERGYHNRLTHSLKVAQVGRRLSEYLLEQTESTAVDEAGGLCPDVVEAACLAHDLGHPPFGHAAEKAIQHQLDERGVFASFEGNPQSFRIVNNVAIHTSAYDNNHTGLDLTLATLNALLKYPWSRGTTGKKNRKWGYYPTEEEEFEKVRELRTPGTSTTGKSLEAAIMDWADDLTYAIHDAIDFYQAGLIPLGELLRDTNEREKFVESFENADASEGIPNRWDATSVLKDRIRQLGDLGGHTGGNTLKSHFDGSSRDRATLGFMVSELVERYLGLDKDVQVKIDPSITGGLDITSELKHEISLLKYLTEYYVFDDPALVAQQHGHREMIDRLYRILYDATDSDSDYQKIIPKPFDEKVSSIHTGDHQFDDIDDRTLRARIVADIIASLTEQQASDLYRRVTGESPGLVTDRIVTY